jgi:transglutaminase-like putative cysteine protease
MRVTALALSGYLLCCGSALAGETKVHPEYRWLSTTGPGELAPVEPLAPARAQELAAQGYGYVELDVRTHMLLKRNGDLEIRRHALRQYLSDTGVQQEGNLLVSVAANRDRATYERAYVQTPDGARQAVPFESLRVQPSEDRNVFSDQRDVIVPLVGLQVGAVAVLDVRILRAKQDWPFPWSAVMILQTGVPVERYELAVEWEAGVEAPRWTSSDADGLCASTGTRSLRCVRERIPAVDIDPDVRSYYDLMPRLVVSAPHTWSDIARAELAQVETALGAAPELDAQARTLTKGAASSREVLDRIHRFVADQIRYVGEEDGIWAVRPHPAAQTLQRRFGDCKDKVALFVALARRAGLTAEPVLASTEHFSVASLIRPASGWFNHMVACAGAKDLPRRCVDLTDPDTAAGELAPAVAGAVALDLRADVEAPYNLERPRFSSSARVKTERRLSCDGSMSERSLRTFGGDLDSGGRAGLRPMTQQQRARQAADGYEEIVGETATIQSTVRHVDDLSGPLEIQDEVRFKERIDWKTESAYNAPDRWLEAFARSIESRNQHHPFELGGIELETETAFEICDRYVVDAVGPALDFRDRFGALTRSYERTEKGVRVRTRLEIPGARIPVAELPRLSRLIEVLLGNANVSFDVKPR